MKCQGNDELKTGKRGLLGFRRWCAYHHLYNVISALIKGEKLSAQIKAGRNIALLGIFCPFFWMALLSGERGSALAFHALHSGMVCLIGIAIMIAGLANQKDRS
ncbi:hypothetical protein EGM51_15295 [Verrucomicrobia bacterium S94]|nr:hypothetical protein EGM51_15295 [Verrucomicrobia bacterium S94]